jgi:uncharacterized SAM-binding protein YcdF (DUF218 family)
MTVGWRLPRRLAIFGLVFVPTLLMSLFVWAFIRVGGWIVLEDPLEPARAIVILGGRMPFRAIEAARIYQRGFASEVWLTRGEHPAEEAALKKLGIFQIPEETYNRKILERMGVPPQSICLLEGPARNTAEEVLVVVRALNKVGGKKVILVTSKPHTRRVKATWQSLVGPTPKAEVRFGWDDEYNPERWWHNTEDALAVSREVFGLLNVWVGFPVRPDRE